MKKPTSYFYKILLFVFFVVLADSLIGFVLYKLYFKQKAGASYLLNYSMFECKSEVLIFGNSRAQHHYDPRIIGQKLNMTCYNAGQDGGHSILLPYAQIKMIIERYIPKVIIVEFSPERIDYSISTYDKISILLPYYRYKEIYPIILLKSKYERLKLLSSIYPFNSDMINIIKFNTNYSLEKKQVFEGYIPLKKVMNEKLILKEIEIPAGSEIDTNLVNALHGIIDICKDKGIKLFIVNSPRFDNKKDKEIEITKNSNIIKKTFQILASNKIPYFDFSLNNYYNSHPEWFQDLAHLNESGANIFSQMISDSISKKLFINNEALLPY